MAVIVSLKVNQRPPVTECKKRLHDWKLETTNRKLEKMLPARITDNIQSWISPKD
jgi:hypothetical protein